MPHETVQLQFPLKGLDENQAYGQQPPLTTQEATNVCAIDPQTGRECGAQRAGTSKYLASTINGANPIQCLTGVVRFDSRLTYTTRTSMSSAAVVSQLALPSRLETISIATDRQGNLFVAAATSGGGTGLNYVIKLNSALQQQWIYPLPMQRVTDVLKQVVLDEEGSIYAVITGSAGPTRIYKLEETGFDLSPVRLLWELIAPNGGWWTCCAVRNNVMYAVELTSTPSLYLHRFDQISSAQPVPSWGNGSRIRTGAGCDECYAIDTADDGGALLAIVDATNPPNAAGQVEKYGPMLPDVVTTPPSAAGVGAGGTAPIWSTGTIYGAGQGIVNKGGYLYSQGYDIGTSYAHVIKFTDSGNSVGSIVANLLIDSQTTFKGTNSLAVDDQGNVYVATVSAGTDTVITKINAAFSNVWELTGTNLGAVNLNAMAVVVDPNNADDGGGSEQAEYIYVGTNALSGNSYKTIHKVSLVTVTQSDGTPRQLKYLAVSNGELRTFTSAAVSTPTGAGTYTFSTTTKFVAAAAAFNRAIFVDGLNGRSYDALTDTISNWTATAGEVPKRARLICIWGGSVLAAGVENDPHNWFLSRAGDLDDFDYFPVTPDGEEAVAGNFSKAGQCPDVVNCIVPYRDDLALFLCDHSIYQMTGRPSAGGRFDLIVDSSMGGAFGMHSACKDELGNVYFWGSKNGLFIIRPGGLPESLSNGRLKRRFEQIDLSLYKVQLVWNPDELCVEIFVSPYSTGATSHYMWDRRGDRFYKRTFATNNHNPLAVYVIDGDAWNDRVLLMGCVDGQVRQWDVDASDDDGTAISTAVTFGPYVAPPGKEHRMTKFIGVLTPGSSNSTLGYSVYKSETPDVSTGLPTASFSGSWDAGRNTPTLDRATGRAIYLRLTSNSSAKRWALAEPIEAQRIIAGRVQNR